MSISERDKLLAFLFDRDDRELVNLKLFRGSEDLITDEELAEQVHSAFVQKQMGKADVAEWLPESPKKINVHEFVASL